MSGFTRDAMDYLTDPTFQEITAGLERKTWAGTTWAYAWCKMLGLSHEEVLMERDLRRTGSIGADHRKDLVEALQARRQPTPATPGLNVMLGKTETARPTRGLRKE